MIFMNAKELSQSLVICSVVIFTGCSGDSDFRSETPESSKVELGNPYNEGTGHDAGYKWAERTGGDCDGNSNSFNEGCEEYYQQQEE
jgi:hypothetical protein